LKYLYLIYFSLLPIVVACGTTPKRHFVKEKPGGYVCLPRTFVEALYYDNSTLFYQRNFWREQTAEALEREENSGVWQQEDDSQLEFEQKFYDVD